MPLGQLTAIKPQPLQRIEDARGELNICTFGGLVPFEVVRLFYIRHVPPGTARGQHGHYRCRQYFICQQGRIRVDMTDGKSSLSILLEPAHGVLIEPGILATETYLDVGSILMVLCDRPYEADDYIRDMDTLITFRSSMSERA